LLEDWYGAYVCSGLACSVGKLPFVCRDIACRLLVEVRLEHVGQERKIWYVRLSRVVRIDSELTGTLQQKENSISIDTVESPMAMH